MSFCRAGGTSFFGVGKAESRSVRLVFGYKFGNKNGKASPRRNTGVEAEKARMDNQRWRGW